MLTSDACALIEVLLAQPNLEWSQVNDELGKQQPSSQLAAFLAQKLRESMQSADNGAGAHGIVLRAAGDAANAPVGKSSSFSKACSRHSPIWLTTPACATRCLQFASCMRVAVHLLGAPVSIGQRSMGLACRASTSA